MAHVNVPILPYTILNFTKCTNVQKYIIGRKYHNRIIRINYQVCEHLITRNVLYIIDVQCLGEWKIKITVCQLSQ